MHTSVSSCKIWAMICDVGVDTCYGKKTENKEVNIKNQLGQ